MTTLSRQRAAAPAARPQPDPAAAMTRAASRQTYTTIRFLADRPRRADAYRAYAYFRWVDDRLDEGRDDVPAARAAFLARQQALLDAGYRGELGGMFAGLCAEERLLAELISGDTEPDSGLQSYLGNMMAVMAFDVARRGRAITATELATYTRMLATAVADALFHFIGHDEQPPRGEARYQAVRGAHIIHMLRDTVEDNAAGYVNVPGEYLAANDITATDLESPPYRAWVEQRVRLARACFDDGRAFMAEVPNRRCRLAGHAYIARFEWLAEVITDDGYRLREAYPQRKSAAAALWMARRTLSGWARPNPRAAALPDPSGDPLLTEDS